MSNDDDDNDDKGQGVISPLVSIALRKRGTAGRVMDIFMRRADCLFRTFARCVIMVPRNQSPAHNNY